MLRTCDILVGIWIFRSVPLNYNGSGFGSEGPGGFLRHLQLFLGLINFYRWFLPGKAGTLQLLTERRLLLPKGTRLLRFSSPSGSWLHSLPRRQRLRHPCPRRPSAALWQIGMETSGFFSRKLSSVEIKYSTFDRELLAAFSAVLHFQSILEGRPFRIYIHQNTLAMSRISLLWSSR